MFPKRRLSHAQGYLELGMIAAATAELDHLPEPEASSLTALGLRLAILQEQADWSTLRDLARVFVNRWPGEAAGWVTWAYAARRADSLTDAETILLAAEREHPAEPTIQFNLGCYASLRGDFATARQRVDRAIALDAKFAALADADPDLAPLRAFESA